MTARSTWKKNRLYGHTVSLHAVSYGDNVVTRNCHFPMANIPMEGCPSKNLKKPTNGSSQAFQPQHFPLGFKHRDVQSCQRTRRNILETSMAQLWKRIARDRVNKSWYQGKLYVIKTFEHQCEVGGSSQPDYNLPNTVDGHKTTRLSDNGKFPKTVSWRPCPIAQSVATGTYLTACVSSQHHVICVSLLNPRIRDAEANANAVPCPTCNCVGRGGSIPPASPNGPLCWPQGCSVTRATAASTHHEHMILDGEDRMSVTVMLTSLARSHCATTGY